MRRDPGLDDPLPPTGETWEGGCAVVFYFWLLVLVVAGIVAIVNVLF